MADNIIKTKSFNFALRIIKLFQSIKSDIVEINKILASIIITSKQKFSTT
ncbi:hypothetical protein SAMN05444388_11132 [Flavobacterium johnsoniae]|uniref:Four helix bundle protein n=1 Tax=Flavobacterium johnsoniae TaxID=986 RepID=A0A1M5T906_FLAJO|nr:hypothetical protein SAMN05444388_11132 [Flavobacterium johnsoniae]